MKSSTRSSISALGTTIGFGLALATPTYAMQISQLTTGLDWIKTTISGVGAVIIVIGLMWVGYKMIFSHAKWSEVASIFFGSIIAGGAAAIGPQLFGGGAGG
jgi:type IV secretion system protein VirB2